MACSLHSPVRPVAHARCAANGRGRGGFKSSYKRKGESSVSDSGRAEYEKNQKESETLGEWDLSEKLKARVTVFAGVPGVDIREFYEADAFDGTGKIMLPGKKGIRLNAVAWAAFVDNIRAINATMKAAQGAQDETKAKPKAKAAPKAPAKAKAPPKKQRVGPADTDADGDAEIVLEAEGGRPPELDTDL